MTKRLIILGASVRAAAFSAIRAGFEPYAIDCYADRDLSAVCPTVKIERYPRDFVPALAAAPQTPWIYTGGLENYPRLVERLAALRSLWGNVGKGLREVRRPVRLLEAAVEAGLGYPRTQSEVSPQERPTRWLVKRRRSSGGLGVRFARDAETARLNRGSHYQEYVEGQAASATFVAAFGRAILLGATQQLLGHESGISDRPFLYAGSIAPFDLNEDEIARLQALGGWLAKQLGLVGLFGIDFIRTSQGLWLIEVNPRYTASVEVLERAMNVSILALHATACQHGELPDQPLIEATSFAGKQVVYAESAGVIPLVFGELVDELNRPGRPTEIADLPRIGERIAAGQPVATVFAGGANAGEVTVNLIARAAAVSKVLSTKY